MSAGEIRRGTYVLFLDFDTDTSLDVGALGMVSLSSGRYCYIGSAMGGLDQRLGRHLSKVKSVRWHIDRLTLRADRMEAYVSYPDPIAECELSHMAMMSGCVPAWTGFGCSDCRCESHLFRTDVESSRKLVEMAHLHRYR